MRQGAKRLAAQIHDDVRPKVVVPYRASPEQKEALVQVFREEARGRKPDGKHMSLSRAVEYVVGLGLDLYWVRNDLGTEMDSLSAEHGWDRRKTLTELVRRGLERKGKK